MCIRDSSYTKPFELVGFFVSLGIPPKIRFGSQNGGNSPTKIWLRYKIFRKFTQFWALQNLMFWKNIARVFMRVSLADFIRSFRLSIWRKPQVCLNVIRVAGIYSVLAQRKEGFKDKDAQTSYDRTS